MRARVLLGALGLVLILAAILPASAQESVSADVTETGWWSNRIGAAERPEGGFEVAAGIDGAIQSMGALRILIGTDSVSTLEIALTEFASSTTGTDFGTIRLCPTTTDWQAANPGPLSEAPKFDCDAGSVDLAHSTDMRYLGDIASLAPAGGEVSLAVVPNYAPPVPLGPGMLVQIDSVTLKATGGGPTTTTSPPVTDFDDSFTPEPNIDLDPGGFTDPGAAFPDPPSPDDAATTPTTLLPKVPQDEFVGGAPIDISADSGETAPWFRLLFLTPLAAAIGLGSVFLRRQLEERGLLGN